MILTVIAGKGYRFISAKGKGAGANGQEKPGASFQVASPRRITDVFSSPHRCVCDNTFKVLSTRQVHLSLGVQGFTDGQKNMHTVSV